MTDNEIKENLEDCGCPECMAILALINRQKAEIERLEKQADEYPFKCKVGNNSEIHSKSIEDYDRLIFDISSEAIKEFAERLKANMSNTARVEFGGNVYFCVGYDLIDNLVKEMTEGV